MIRGVFVLLFFISFSANAHITEVSGSFEKNAPNSFHEKEQNINELTGSFEKIFATRSVASHSEKAVIQSVNNLLGTFGDE